MESIKEKKLKDLFLATCIPIAVTLIINIFSFLPLIIIFNVFDFISKRFGHIAMMVFISPILFLPFICMSIMASIIYARNELKTFRNCLNISIVNFVIYIFILVMPALVFSRFATNNFSQDFSYEDLLVPLLVSPIFSIPILIGSRIGYHIQKRHFNKKVSVSN